MNGRYENQSKGIAKINEVIYTSNASIHLLTTKEISRSGAFKLRNANVTVGQFFFFDVGFEHIF